LIRCDCFRQPTPRTHDPRAAGRQLQALPEPRDRCAAARQPGLPEDAVRKVPQLLAECGLLPFERQRTGFHLQFLLFIRAHETMYTDSEVKNSCVKCGGPIPLGKTKSGAEQQEFWDKTRERRVQLGTMDGSLATIWIYSSVDSNLGGNFLRSEANLSMIKLISTITKFINLIRL